MRILVTGLCLQGNKGGPALALTLKRKLSEYIPGAEFVFSVPSGKEFKYEKKSAAEYGVEIVEDFSHRDYLPPYVFRNYQQKRTKVKKWIKTLSDCDAVVEMCAINYVGPPIGRQKDILLGGRLRYFLLSILNRKPFLAWTQSYGPFSNPLIRFIARQDLKRQPVVFCRGESCLELVKGLIPGKEAYSFPDVATLLEYDNAWGENYLASIERSITSNKIVSISPSAKLFGKANNPPEVNSHVLDISNFCRHLINKGYFIVLVPHTLRPDRPDPTICDYAVSLRIFEELDDNSSIHLVEDDFSPMQLKSIISASYIHVGARYHSVVAALSSGVPCISLSWYHKYKDIMSFYGMEKFVYDGLKCDTANLINLFDQIVNIRGECAKQIKHAHEHVENAVEKNVKMFTKTLLGMRN